MTLSCFWSASSSDILMPSTTDRRRRVRITVHGIVQGVGFRPFVHRLATELGLAGAVHNFTGGVHIEIEGRKEDVESFLMRLPTEHPPLAVIENVEVAVLEPTGQTGFAIAPSRSLAGPVFVSPDIALCPDCRRELLDPHDRRYRHPFVNCTNCGPRFTLIHHLPYDRPNTSMSSFPMCALCWKEYGDITDRRYHAQPVCCPRCGPTLWLTDSRGVRRGEGEDALAAARRLLARGGIVAIKGLGGFHLACDATSEAAVNELRRRKRRWEKPFAVMAPTLDAVERFALTDVASREVLTGPRAPIVLLPKRLPEVLAPSVAPGTPDYGVMLPYTPLHVLLLGPESDGNAFLALVMTSGNLSDEPLCTDNDEALSRLGVLADAFLLHDRDILAGCDDSVVRPSARGLVMMRRSRGWVPLPVRLPVAGPPSLGVGGHLKNTFCVAADTLAYPSQHLGDLDNAETLEYWERSLARMIDLTGIRPEVVACDLHPDYPSTRLAARYAEEGGLPLVQVQHHHAHLAACLADNGLAEPVVGLMCDGTGYGTDGTVWGCEVLVGGLAHFERVGRLRYIGLPGGDRAVTEPWRCAAAWLADCYGLDTEAWPQSGRRLLAAVGRERVEAVLALLRKGVNCPYASSSGRLFDAVAALVGLRHEVAYEAEAAMFLEAAAARALAGGGGEASAYPFDTQVEPAGSKVQDGGVLFLVPGSQLVMDPRATIAAIAQDVADSVPTDLIALRFHKTFAEMLLSAASWACEETGLDLVALSGGTFQNRLLLELVADGLECLGLRPVLHSRLSPNDSALGVGQVAVAMALAASGSLQGSATRAGRRG